MSEVGAILRRSDAEARRHGNRLGHRRDILNIGGFSDAVFSVVASFFASDAGRFVAEIESVEM